jgi:cation transport protein ChaC
MTHRITRENLQDGTMLDRIRGYAKQFPDMKFRSEDEMAALLVKTLAEHDPAEDLYVFGYGSLIWNPAFHFVSKLPATLHGWHRRFCLRLLAGRGAPETPGLMLALDHGGACKGVASASPLRRRPRSSAFFGAGRCTGAPITRAGCGLRPPRARSGR